MTKKKKKLSGFILARMFGTKNIPVFCSKQPNHGILAFKTGNFKVSNKKWGCFLIEILTSGHRPFSG